MSLAEKDMLRIVEDTRELVSEGSRLLVHVTYSDAYGKKHQDDMEVDFDQLKQGQFPYIFNRLDELSESLSDIERKLSSR